MENVHSRNSVLVKVSQMENVIRCEFLLIGYPIQLFVSIIRPV